MKAASVLAALLLLSGCSGWRYEVVDDDRQWLLLTEHYNHNPFVTYRWAPPYCYLLETRYSKIVTKEHIVFSNRNGEKIADGYIVDRDTEVEIRLLMSDRDNDRYYSLHENLNNGVHKITRRTHVDNLDAYMQSHENIQGMPELLEQVRVKHETTNTTVSAMVPRADAR